MSPASTRTAISSQRSVLLLPNQSRVSAGGVPLSRQTRVADTFVELADSLLSDFDVTEFLTTLTGRVVELLPVDSAGVLLVRPDGAVRIVAASSDAAALLELFELQHGDGPCLECRRTGESIVNVTVSSLDARWPGFGAAAASQGVVVVHALPLRYGDRVIGALHMLSNEDVPVSQSQVRLARALADVATISILQHRATADSDELTSQLNAALESRIVIEQAKGVLAEAGSVDMQAAFDALRRHARDRNLRLAVVAASVVDHSIPASDVLDSAGPDH